MSTENHAVFLSYTSQDAEAARRMAETLRAAGIEVWFDQNELRGGEAWDAAIRKQVRGCALFLPIISANTEVRREGYFRLEWKMADDRTHLMAKGTPFLVPVCLDDTRDQTALVPDSFLAVQWTRLPGGEMSAAFCAQVKRLLAGGPRETGPAAAAAGAAPVIPDFELIRVIGQGSYGDVWLARGLTGVYRAIKIVWRDRFADAEPFEREFKGLKKFTTMSLPEASQMALLHVGQNERAGFFYYVMELADDVATGRTVDPANYAPLTLKEVRQRRGRLPAAECLTTGLGLARALAGLHSRGLVHRDIKPSNVILVGGVPKLADIGLVAETTDALTYVGTEGFVPPEGPGKPGADVYAFGRLLYELATGLDREEFPRLPPELGRMSDRKLLLALNKVILRACEPSPAQRYRDAGAILADLEALPAGRSGRRRPGLMAGLVAAGLAGVALGAGLWWKSHSLPVVTPTPQFSVPGSSVASPAQALSARMGAIFDKQADATRDELILAMDLGAQLVALEPTNAGAWAAYAQATFNQIESERDNTHYADALSRAQRAMGLAGDAFEPRFALADVYRWRPATLDEGVRLLQQLAKERPTDRRILRSLAWGLRAQGKYDEALAVLDRAIALPGGDYYAWFIRSEVLMSDKRVDEAEAAVEKALAMQVGVRGVMQNVYIKNFLRDDPAATMQAMAQIPGSFLLRELEAWAYGSTWLQYRQPEKSLECFRAFDGDFVHGEPKGYYTGRALEMAGRPEAAQLEWHAALHLVEGRLTAKPDDPGLLHWQAMLLACLGEPAAAQKILQVVRRVDLPGQEVLVPLILARLGRNPEAIEELTARWPRLNWFAALAMRAAVLHDAFFDPLRGDPHFQAFVEKIRSDPRYPLPQKVPVLSTASAPVFTLPAAPAAATPSAVVAEKSVAVLPFENLSDDKENGYFAEGVHEDILTDLANLSGLRVIARTTMVQYRATTKTVRQIGVELNVAYVLEGTVRRAGHKVRVTGQLVRAATEEQVWAKTYDRDLTDIFAIQSDLSRDIATSLSSVITAQDESRLTSRPTTSIAAYELVQRARMLQQTGQGGEQLSKEVSLLYEQAVQLDPKYAEAWAALVEVHLGAYGFQFEFDAAEQAKAREALSRAEQLAPDNYAVLMAGASFGALTGDRDLVNRKRKRIAELYPNRAEGLYAGALTASYEGRWDDALAGYREALALDPHNTSIMGNLQDLLGALRHYDELRALLHEFRALKPADLELAYEEALLPLRQHGSTKELEAFLAGLPPNPGGADATITAMRTQALLALGDAAGLVRLWREAGSRWDNHTFGFLNEAALAMALLAVHDPASARTLAEQARDHSREILAKQPASFPRLNVLGLSLALLGENTEARATLARFRDMLRADQGSKGDFLATGWLYNAIWRAWAGEKAEAVAQMAQVLKGAVAADQGYVNELRRSFFTLPLHGYPPFEALLDDPANNAPLSGASGPMVIPPEVAIAAAPPPAAGERPLAPPESAQKSIAVLPFENLNDDKQDAFFADGIHEELLTDLANIASLRVISRTSVMRYRGTTKTMGEIAGELGVQYILEGSVRRVGQKVRVTGQLIRAATDTHVWAKAYDGDLGDILTLQAQLATSIAGQLAAVLTPEETKRLSVVNLADPKAYDLYLRAKELRRQEKEPMTPDPEAEAMFRQATELDPKFALPWIELGRLHLEHFFQAENLVAERDLAKADLDRAAALAPNWADVEEGLGEYYYYGFSDFTQAGLHYERALALAPSDARVHNLLGLLARRQGHWREARAELKQAHELDPFNHAFSVTLRTTLSFMHLYPEAKALVLEMAKADPDDFGFKIDAAFFQANIDGSTRALEAVWAGLTPAQQRTPEMRDTRLWLLFNTGKAKDYLNLAESIPASGPEALDPEQRIQLAMVRRILGRVDPALLADNRAVLEKQVQTDPDGPDNWASLALNCALQGDRVRTEAALQRTIDLTPEDKDKLNWTGLAEKRAQVLAWLGDKDKAIALFAAIVRLPGSGIHPVLIKHGLEWWPLHDDPRFEAILADPATYQLEY